MALTLNKRVWVLAERLYIAVHGTSEFLDLLRSFDITATAALSTCRSATPTGSQRPISSPRSAVEATRTTTLWPSR